MQGSHVRVPHADFSTQKVPQDLWNTEIEDGLVMCSDILPTGFEVGLLDGDIKKGRKTNEWMTGWDLEKDHGVNEFDKCKQRNI